MARFWLILATILALLMGTGSFNLLCVCCPSACPDRAASQTTCATRCDARPAKKSATCCKPKVPAKQAPQRPDKRPAPCDTPPERCPCLYWTAVPLSHLVYATGPALIKRMAAVMPLLLLEAAPAPMWRGAAASIRAGPLGPGDTHARPQAWLCLWTI